MNLILPLAPKIKDLAKDAQEWLDNVQRVVMPECSTSADAAASVPSASDYHGVTALTSPRTLTFPPTANLKDGQGFVIQDESGSAGTHTISFAANGTDTIYGATTITTNYGRRVCIKRGIGKWYCA